jgi:Uma2 family endonuclease
MAMRDTARRYAVDEVLAFPDDGNRYELVDGELLVTPAPSMPHQVVISHLQFTLTDYLRERPAAVVLASPADISWDCEKLVHPDLFVIPGSEVSRSWKSVRTLRPRSRSSHRRARGDRWVKRRLYQRQGVATYWVVDPDARLVEVWHPPDERPEIVMETLRWSVGPDATELQIDLRALFAHLPD